MMVRGITMTCFILLLSHEPSLSFVLPPRRANKLAHLGAKRPSTEGGSKRKKRSSKPRRFSQEAHSSLQSRRPKQRRSSRREESENDDRKEELFWDPSFKRMLKPKDTDFMLQSGKSIEELESIMTKRWGTEVQKWTADPSEYEFVEGKGSDSNDKSSVFRGKPVLDPWQKEEQRQNPNVEESGGGFFSRQDDAMLSRVRKNQRRLQKKTRKDDASLYEKQPKATDDEIEGDATTEGDCPGEMITEFYDEEDEGFDPYKRNGHKDNEEDTLYSMGNLIHPELDGGRGSKSIPERKTKKLTGHGFFFNDAAAVQQPSEMVEEISQQPDTSAKAKKDKPTSNQVFDEDGNPIYLTVEQAQRNFQSCLDPGEDNTVDYTPPVTKTWEELGITSSQLLRNLQKMGCSTPLSVQNKACSPIMTGNDVLVGTYTGSGKTLAFLVPLAERLLFAGSSGKDVRVLIVAPGRELASQIVSVARSLLEGTDLSVILAIGGTTFGRNLEQIRKKKPIILVGTPGRIAELVVGRPGEKSGRLKIGSLQSLVLDEFDALLEYKPHRDPTNAIVHSLQRRHGDALQSILCSATASDMMKSPKLQNLLRQGYVEAMADEDDRLITSGDETPGKGSNAVTRVSKTVMHGAIHIPHRRVALETLRRILHTEPLPQQVLVFADTSHRVEIIVDKLADFGIIAAPLHGGRGSDKVDRAEVSKALREGYVGIVVATEMAARGLDAPLLTHVINLDLPTDASHYAHRAGRCGRGGRPGVVINFTTKPKERNVPRRFADSLGVTMHHVEARGGKLCVVEDIANS